jgi:hypothetical protein
MDLLIGQSYIVYEQILLAQGIDRPADICPVGNCYAFWTVLGTCLSQVKEEILVRWGERAP